MVLKSDACHSSSRFRWVYVTFSVVCKHNHKNLPFSCLQSLLPWRQQRIIVVTQSTVVRRVLKPAWNRPWSPNAGGTSHRDQHKHTVKAASPSSNKAATVCRTNKSFSLIVIENNWKPFGGVQKMNMLILSNSCWMCAADKLSERKERWHCRRGKKAQPRFSTPIFLVPF